MTRSHTVQSGDCISSIAYEHGFFWETLWNLPENAELKSRRKDPNVLQPGDEVKIPEKSLREESGATEARHQFRLKGVPARLRLRLLNAKQKPRANLDYVLVVEGVSHEGKTDGGGFVKATIPPDARKAKLQITEDGKLEEYELRLGHIDPVSEIAGVQQRLINLGLGRGVECGVMDPMTRKAIRAFQAQAGLPVTGEADAATREKLLKAHGC